ncbi:TonB-dependent receptor [Maribellus maritimus]|uniref:TonB-dependent receptor n=1 Tax=Maribellus maritimus TaxID=2870838 RepID=UPI001EECEEB9|nr:TonB-dependent receptor [Maribellus maritimus]MCG6190032.1 TonB-dependent receptor [Maribellus maritimus]
MKKIYCELISGVYNIRKSNFLRKMRIVVLLFLISITQTFALESYAQTKRLSLNLQGETIINILNKIEDESEFYFMFDATVIDVNQRKSIKCEDQPIVTILNQLLEDTKIVYEISDRQIVLTSKQESAVGQQKTVSGKVTDSSGAPLPGVTVVVKETTNGTVTNASGAYSLANVSGEAILQFSFIGMRTQEVIVGPKTEIDVVMQEEAIGIEEVVAIGYGTTSRQNFTGSVTTLKIEDSPAALNTTTNALSLLRGTTSGVNLTQNGEAGEVPEILIRGQKSISGGSSPLFIVDGVIFSGGLNDIDINNIETITVLKDATSLAAYGSKAANGVVMITTKKGKSGKPSIVFDSSVALSTPDNKPEMRDPQGYLELMNRRSGYAPDADPAWMSPLERANYEAGTTTNWRDYIVRTGILQNYSLSFSGATEYTNFYLSSGFQDQKGNYYGDDYSRKTFSAKVSTNVADYIEIGANASTILNNYDGVSPSYGAAIHLTPFGESLLQNGNMRKHVDGKDVTAVNPLWNTYNGVDHEMNRKTNILGGFINIDIPKVTGLSFRVNGSYTLRSSDTRHFTHETNYPEMSLGDDGYTTEIFDMHLIDANGYIIESSNTSWVLDNILNYTREINDHYINASLVYTRNSTKIENKRISGSDFTGIGNTILGVYGLPNAEVQKIENFNYSLHNDIGYLARMNYSLKNTYHLNISTRYDGSSVFGTDKKWGFFPAVGGAWTISNEGFMKNVHTIDNLKLKLSWGLNGNQSLAPYGTLSTVAMGRGGQNIYYFGDVVYGQSLSALGNSELGWESTTSVNYGFEGDILQRRLHIGFDGYKSITKDQIFERVIPVMGTGLTTQYATMGRVDNWGAELNISGLTVSKGDFQWNTGLIFYINRNKLVELYGDGQDDIANSLFLGKSLGAIYGYKWDGIVQEGEENYLSNISATPGDAKYADLSGDGQLTAADRTILGYSKENFHMSMTNTFRYKNFEAYILINGIFGGKGYGMARNNDYYLTADGYQYNNTLDHTYWTAENKSPEFPRWDYMDEKFIALQSYGFVRLQDVNVSYNFNSDMLSRYGLRGLKLYVTCSNLFFYSPHWKGSDPEVRSINIAQLPRTFNFGLNVKF